MRKMLFSLLLLFFLITAGLGSQSIAFTGTENRSDKTGYDYLGAIIEGVLLYDLSKVPGITIVERKRLETVLAEQRLSLSGLTGDSPALRPLEVGKLLSADYLLSAEYAVLGEDVTLTAYLMDSRTGTVLPFAIRAVLENDIHSLAQRIAKNLTGQDYSFVNPAEKRNLLTLRDLTPGSISLFCNLLHGEILLDGRFIGYTDGNLYTPLILSDLDPGTYKLRIRLNNDFGTIKLPEFLFSDWEEEVTVRPGRATIVRAVIRHFNEQVYGLSKIHMKDYILTPEKPNLTDSASYGFTDRQGKEITISYVLRGEYSGDTGKVYLELTYGGVLYRFQVDKNNPELEERIGHIQVVLRHTAAYPRETKASFQIWRTDIYQGMHRE